MGPIVKTSNLTAYLPFREVCAVKSEITNELHHTQFPRKTLIHFDVDNKNYKSRH
jgi:hypothetical protein